MNNLANLYFIRKEYKKAEKYFLKGLAIQKTVLGIEHMDYALSLNNLANLYDQVEDYATAEKLASEALNIRKNIFGESNTDYATSLNTLAVIYYHSDNISMAKTLFLEAVQIQKHTIGINNKVYTNYLLNLSKIYIKEKDYSTASNLIKQVSEILNQNILNIIISISPLRQVQYYSTLEYQYENIKSILFSLKDLNYLITASTYNNELQNKGMILRNSQNVQNAAMKSGDSILLNILKDIQNIKSTLSKYYFLAFNSPKYDIIKLEDEADQLEKKLVQSSKAYRNLKEQFGITWENVQYKLTKSETAIEFICIKYYNKKWTDSVLYGALILRPDFIQPKFIFLFEEKQLLTILTKEAGILDQSYVNRLYQKRENGNLLYKLIWQPLDSLLQGVTTIYVTPSGLLHKIALGAIPNNDGSTFSSKYGLQIIGTTADIINKKEDFIDNKSIEQAFVFGGINYDIASSKAIDLTSNSENKIYAYLPTDSTRGATGKWNYLGGALKEAEETAGEFKKQKISTHFYSDSTATETLFKNIPLNRNSVLHIATHGYFFPDVERKKEDGMKMIGEEKQTAFKVSENPLLRSGLIFAGANPAWTNPDYVSTATDDGILTAYEISNMDLSNVKLVVLSACETGLGDIKGSEGVFGLQRAFKLAGVKNIIMSLWKVPDEKTRELMQTFYQFCFSGKSISEAFKSTQEMMRSKYPNSPYFWAGFTLLQ